MTIANFGKGLVTALLLNSCAAESVSTRLGASPASNLRVTSYGAAAAGFHVTSHLIYGDTEAVLVDAQFTRSEAANVAEMIKATGKTLTTIFVTHAHPDHYFGVEVLRKEFPGARVVANKKTIEGIKEEGPKHLEEWKPLYGADLTDTVPEVIELEGALTVDGEELDILELEAGESAHASVVVIPQLETAIVGDALSDQVHFWLAEGRLAGVRKNFGALKALGNVKLFLAGHTTEAIARNEQLIEQNIAYLTRFETELAKSHSAGDLAKRIKDAFSAYALPEIAEISSAAFFK